MKTLFIFLISLWFMSEHHKTEKEIDRLIKKCADLEEENETLKNGRIKRSVGEKRIYFTENESKRYDEWLDFYNFDKIRKVGILTDDDYANIVINGIFKNITNQEILDVLIKKSYK